MCYVSWGFYARKNNSGLDLRLGSSKGGIHKESPPILGHTGLIYMGGGLRSCYTQSFSTHICT